MNMILDAFVFAVKSIKHRKTRSWLTIVGIFIGVAAVVALISLSQGMSAAINEEFDKIGKDKIIIMPGISGGQQYGPSLGSSQLYKEDAETIEHVRGVEAVETMLTQFSIVEFNGKEKPIGIFGASPSIYESFPQFEIAEGRPLRENDHFKAVLGDTLATETFDEKIQLRNSLKVDDHSIRVVGIMEPVGNPTDDKALMIPMNTARELFKKEDEVSTIYVDTDETFDIEEVKETIEDELEDERGTKDFSVQTTEQIRESIDNVLGLVQGLMLGIAALSLLVGGVGIMNTMYTSVLEKTREIGIMKSVGAKNSHILGIFLIESGLIGVIGGIIGIILGAILGKVAEYGIIQMTGLSILEIAITPELILGALAFSFGIGSLSGVLPARKAAKLKPTDSLRYE
ncbi:MAG: ABC transporter permease [Candidatus Aenigmatarchaeota archaeon]